jgi:hypothetical protein
MSEEEKLRTLREHAGLHNMHNFCFLGNNPRIGTACDFVFGEVDMTKVRTPVQQLSHQHGLPECCHAAFVPEGPKRQLEMYFHAVEQIKAGKEQVNMKVQCITAISNRSLLKY